MPLPISGHAPGHLRELFLLAIDALTDWDGVGAEPLIEAQLGRYGGPMSISQVCGTLWSCSDCLPGSAFDQIANWLDGTGVELKRRTYAAAARAVHAAIRQTAEYHSGHPGLPA